MSDSPVDWNTVNNIVEPEHQYLEVESPPIDEVRMAWPFKTEEEREIIRKWYKKDQAELNKHRRESVGVAKL